MQPRTFALMAGLAIFLLAGPTMAAPGPAPQPPCGGPPNPDYPAIDAAPAIHLWKADDLEPAWTPPACITWQGPSNIIVGLSGRFAYSGTPDALLTRMGAISTLEKVRYWSVTDKQWMNMFTHAEALEGQDIKKKRGDFSAAEMHATRDLYFVAADNRSGKDSVSRIHVIAADDRHIVLKTENVTPLRWSFLTYAGPGSLQTWYFLDRDAGATWRFYSLTRVHYSSSLFAGIIPSESYINREAAMYLHFLGLATDRGPPAAP
jgi:hypothetical protein